MSRYIGILLFTAFSCLQAFSQTENGAPQVIIILEDKSEIKGELISETETKITIQNENLGLLTFDKTEIRKLLYLDAKGRIKNPNPTRYFLGQSAFTLPKGDGYYQNIYGVVNIVGYGLSDRLSIAGGVELISLFSGAPFFYTNIKYGTKVAKNLRIGGSYSMILGVGDNSAFVGTLNGLITYGNIDHNLTFGSGFAFSEEQFDNSGILTIAGTTRISNRFALITENYVLTSGEDAILAGGVRIIGKKTTIDIMITEGFLPLVDIVLTF